jgi:hypothetical protein
VVALDNSEGPEHGAEQMKKPGHRFAAIATALAQQIRDALASRNVAFFVR